MSFRIRSSASAELFTMPRNCRCSGCSGVASTSSVIPMMPFIGVRTSWLMLATNSLLARLAASAASLALREVDRLQTHAPAQRDEPDQPSEQRPLPGRPPASWPAAASASAAASTIAMACGDASRSRNAAR